MYNIVGPDIIVKGSVLVVEKVIGETVHVSILDASKPQIRTGPSFKDVKPKKDKPDKGNK